MNQDNRLSCSVCGAIPIIDITQDEPCVNDLTMSGWGFYGGFMCPICFAETKKPKSPKDQIKDLKKEVEALAIRSARLIGLISKSFLLMSDLLPANDLNTDLYTKAKELADECLREVIGASQ